MEIEVKAKVADLISLRGALEELGCTFFAPVVQDDTVFVRTVGTIEEYLCNSVFLRVRIQNDGTVLLTAKKATTQSAENLVKTEYEVVVNSADEVCSLLELAGFQRSVHVRKTRQKSHYGAYEICLDDIDGLGSFIELEQIAEEHAAENIQREMFAFLGSLGISPEDQVKKGYDILMLEKQLKSEV